MLNADSIVNSIESASPAEKAAILDEYVLKVVNPYLVITGILLLLALMVYLSKLPEISESEETDDEAGATKSSILQFPYLVLGVVALFMAGGCEVIPIDGIILYSRSMNIPLQESRHFAEYTLYAMLVGYVLSTVLIPKWISQQYALKYCAIAGLLLITSAYVSEGLISIYCLIGTGFGAAMLWGTIWGLAIRNLKKFTKLGSALLLMSVIGGGIFPLIFGSIIDWNPSSPQRSLLVLIPCYAFLFYYAVWGYKKTTWRKMAQEAEERPVLL